jgi:cell division septum initiation protein DivIVA
VHGPQDDHGLHDDVVPLHQPFETALRGFNRQQVLEHIESLDGQVSIMGADRDAALKQVAELSKVLDHMRRESEMLTFLRREAEKANAQIERMQRAPIVGASHRIQNIVRLAEEEAAELRANAQQEVAELRAAAQKEVTELRNRADREVSAQRSRSASEADKLLRETTQRCRQLETDSERRRKAAEQDSTREINRRESESAVRIKQRETRSTAAVYAMLRVVALRIGERIAAIEAQEAELVRTRDHATQELKALEAVRSEIATRLTSTHHILEQVLEEVEPSPADQAEAKSPLPAQRINQMDEDPVIGQRTVQMTQVRHDQRHR